MTVWSALLSFAVVAGLLTIVPGLDTAFALRTALTQGRRPAFAAALGIGTGSLVWGAAAAVGVPALLTTSELLYTVVRLAGAGYLLWLGFVLIRDTFGRRVSTSPAEGLAPLSTEPPPGAAAWRAWRRGVLTNLLNPKVGAFYVAVIPQFLPAHAPHLAMGLALALVHNAEGMAWFTALILAAHTLRRWLSRAAVKRAIDRVTGAALLAFGLKLAVSPS